MKVRAAMTAFWHPLLSVWFRTPEGESVEMRLAEMRHGLSQHLMNLATFGWEARGEPLAALRFLYASKMPEKPRAFQVPRPVSGQTYPCKPLMGEGIRWLLFMPDFG